MNIKMAVCALIGHSRIISFCFGYQYCGRCEMQLGDTLGGVGIGHSVGIGHNCENCYANYKTMTWRDKLFVKNPLTGPMETEAEQRDKFRKIMANMKAERERAESNTN